MFPIDIPEGTTLQSLFTKVLPETHARFVPAAAEKTELRVVTRVRGGTSYTLAIRGNELAVREGEDAGVSLWTSVDGATVQRFLDDWMGPKRFVPKVQPAGGLVLLTDPRILKRLMMVSGRVELSIPDFEGGRIAMTVGTGDAARKGIATESPDAKIETKMATFEKVLAGTLAPEEAIADGLVTLTGKIFVAMQLAFAIGPFFPPQRR